MMINLYRGLVDILINQTEVLNKHFVKHIRTFNDGDAEENFGSAGFWNLLLEVTYIFYVKTFVAFGILMTLSLAIIFFPLYAMRKAFFGAFSGTMPRFDQPILHKEPKIEIIQEKK